MSYGIFNDCCVVLLFSFFNVTFFIRSFYIKFNNGNRATKTKYDAKTSNEKRFVKKGKKAYFYLYLSTYPFIYSFIYLKMYRSFKQGNTKLDQINL